MSEHDELDELDELDGPPPTFSARELTRRQVTWLSQYGQREALARGRGALVWFEGVEELRYLQPKDFHLTPLGPAQLEILTNLITRYNQAAEFVLLRVDYDGQGKSMGIYAVLEG